MCPSGTRWRPSFAVPAATSSGQEPWRPPGPRRTTASWSCLRPVPPTARVVSSAPSPTPPPPSPWFRAGRSGRRATAGSEWTRADTRSAPAADRTPAPPAARNAEQPTESTGPAGRPATPADHDTNQPVLPGSVRCAGSGRPRAAAESQPAPPERRSRAVGHDRGSRKASAFRHLPAESARRTIGEPFHGVPAYPKPQRQPSHSGVAPLGHGGS